MAAGTPESGGIQPVQPRELTVPASPSSSPAPPATGGTVDPRPASIVAEGRRTKILAAVAVVVVIAVALAGYVVTTQHHAQAASSGPPVVVAKQLYRTLPGGQYDAVDFVSPAASVLNGTIMDTWGESVFYTMTPGDLLNLSIHGVVTGYAWTSGSVSNHTTLHLNVSVAAGEWDFVFLNPQMVGVFGGNQTVLWFETGVYLTPA